MNSMTLRQKRLFIIGLLFIVLAASACNKEIEYALDNHSLAIEDAETVQATIEMRSGELTIGNGTENSLLVAELAYNVENDPPTVDYQVSDGQGNLSIEGDAQSVTFSLGGQDNIWDLAFSNEVPLALDVSISDADAEMDLSSLTLTQLTVGGNVPGISADVSGEQEMLTAVNINSNSGRINLDLTGDYSSLSTINSDTNSADVTLDLTGSWEQNVTGSFSGGTGNDVTLILPKDVGVSVTIDSTNEVTAVGFINNGDTYTNDVWGETAVSAGSVQAVSIQINIIFTRGDVYLTQEN